MRSRRCGLALLALLAVLLASAAGLPDPDRSLKRSDAKKWKRIADVSRLKARSGARQFLEEASAELVVPIEVDVILVGFEADGGYGYRLDGGRLLNMLSAHLGWFCPYSWETEEELGVCMHVNFQVMSSADNAAVSTLLHKLEAAMKAQMTHSHTVYDDKIASGQRRYYTLEASSLEPLFNEFLTGLYGTTDASSSTAGAGGDGQQQGGVTGTGSIVTGGRLGSPATEWHAHNAVFVLNPSKFRINPEGPPGAESHIPPDFMHEWDQGAYDEAKLAAEEGGFLYRYTYNGVGEGVVWHSSRNYIVLDLAAGPTSYGPLVSQGGAVTPQGLPSIHATYAELMAQLLALPQQMTQREAGREAAAHGLTNLLAGRLAATLAAATKAAFIPDVSTQHLEQAKTVLVPLVVLTDHPISDDDPTSMTQDDYWGVNVTHVEAALGHLLGEGQEAVVITTHHELHAHKALASALHKATRTHSEAVLDLPDDSDYKGHDIGMHVHSHTFIDPEVLMGEVELAADMLTHGLVTVAHTMGKDDQHHIAQLRHDGTRVIPVFVLVLQNHPEDVVLSNRELVAHNHDAVVVLQLRHGSRWGGPNEFFTGHMANGRRVVVDGAASTRHVIAGLASALAGITPPYQHYEPAAGRLVADWRWAVGATPFGPYSNFSGVSETMQNVARRNALLAHVSAALRQLQHQLDALDAFVAHHFAGPWEAAGMKDGHRHWLDTVASTRHGYNSTLAPDVVFRLEAALANISTTIEELAMDMFVHDFANADARVSHKLLPQVAALCTDLDVQLEAADEVMQCCALRGGSFVTQAALLVLACAGGAAVFFALVGVALCARFAKRKAVKSLGLPTYGLPTYGGKGGWSL